MQILMELIDQFEYDLGLQAANLKENLDMYYAMLHVSDFSADADLDTTHNNITDLLYKQKAINDKKLTLMSSNVKLAVEKKVDSLRKDPTVVGISLRKNIDVH